jgi:hypothetical protein
LRSARIELGGAEIITTEGTKGTEVRFSFLSRCHAVALSRCHAVTLSRCHAVTLSRCHALRDPPDP